MEGYIILTSHLTVTIYLLPSELSSKVLQNWSSLGFEDIVFGTGFGGISSMNIGPDGLLYVVSVEHGKVYKIMPSDN